MNNKAVFTFINQQQMLSKGLTMTIGKLINEFVMRLLTTIRNS